MMNWLRRLWRFFFVTENDSRNEEQKVSRGRIESRERRSEVKVVNHYPKKGNFRFPLIGDENMDKHAKNQAKRVKMKEKRAVRPQKNTFTEPKRQKREKFTGENFQASDVPSPIFGFRERQSPSYVSQISRKGTEEQAAAVEVDALQMQTERAQADEQPMPQVVHTTSNVKNEEPVTNVPEAKSSNQAIAPVVEAQPNLEKQQEADEDADLKLNEVTDQPEKAPSYKEIHVESNNAKREHVTEPETIQAEKVASPTTMKVEQVVHSQGNGYQFPPHHLLETPPGKREENDSWLDEQKELLSETLTNFNVDATVSAAVKGPSVTRLEVQPNRGVKVNRVTNLADDIKLNLSAKEIRIEAPIPGRNAIGIEVPNPSRRPVGLKEIISSPAFQKSGSPLTVALGVDISGQPIITDLRKMPHGLIAGATGSGKSVCINAMLVSLMFKANPDEVKLMLIDPKVVELAPYNDLPHLVTPVVTDVKEATVALKWAVEEMEKRYQQFAELKVRGIEKYNEAIKQCECDEEHDVMPYLVIIIDELADLMMVSPQEVEDAICRIAQKARACGIHLLVATQRPSVDVITGLIKANIPTRIAFSVSSQIDSRTIIDMSGAEKLLGQGDMLLLENSTPKPIRLQGNFVSDDEVERITTFVKTTREANYLIEQEDLVELASDEQLDEIFFDACDFIFSQGAASTSSLQRRFRIGYNRAANLIDKMEESGMISNQNGSKPRKVLLTKKEFYAKMNKEI